MATTLHIEHAVTDYDTWKAAFDRFADFRTQHGVRAHRICQPVDDPAWLVIDLDFDHVEQAATVEAFLRSAVWSSPATAPALVGTPVTRILERVG